MRAGCPWRPAFEHVTLTGPQPPRVSIIIPTCDRRALLERVLDGLRKQTRADFEAIVVDDCSADGTPATLRDFAQRYPGFPLVSLRNQTHAGANPSRNRGVAAARGELIAFLDGDCAPQPDWLERLIAPFADEKVGAVVGRVDDPPARNLYELTFKGTHRVFGAADANRLIAGNMAVRRAELLEIGLDEDRALPQPRRAGRPDTTVSGRGDEEGLYLRLKAAGWRVAAAHDAGVLHLHHFGARTFFRQAWRGGRSAARLVYKYRLPQRLDLAPFALAYLTAPLGALGGWGWAPAIFFAAAALGAVTYNDLFRKRKTVVETIVTFPLLLAYYQLRLAGYAFESLRLRVSRNRPARLEKPINLV